MTDPAAHTPRPSPASHALQAAPTRDARESAIAELTRHFAEDRLTIDEFERRAELAYAATTIADLDALTTDLAQPVTHLVAPSRVSALFSNQERSGPGAVPTHQRVSSVFGNVELDLRQATFAPGLSEIEVSAVFGNVEITVPGYVRVEVTGGAILGSFGSHGDASASDGAYVLRVSGRAILGNVEVHRGRVGAPSAFARPPK